MGIKTGRRKNPESAIVKACLDLLALKGILAWRANQIPVPLTNGKGFRRFAGRRGVSDIVGVLDGGRALAVECKTEAGKVSPDQHAFLDDVQRRGGLALVVRSVGELAKALDLEGI